METSNNDLNDMNEEDKRLNNADRVILRYLEQDGRVTAAYLEKKTEWQRQYLTQRLVRLNDLGLIHNLEDTGLYDISDGDNMEITR